jgi:hypothetical protein
VELFLEWREWIFEMKVFKELGQFEWVIERIFLLHFAVSWAEDTPWRATI